MVSFHSMHTSIVILTQLNPVKISVWSWIPLFMPKVAQTLTGTASAPCVLLALLTMTGSFGLKILVWNRMLLPSLTQLEWPQGILASAATFTFFSGYLEGWLPVIEKASQVRIIVIYGSTFPATYWLTSIPYFLQTFFFLDTLPWNT